VAARLVACCSDEGADGLVGDEEGPGFLAGEAGGAGAQDAAAGEVGLGLAVGGLNRPLLMPLKCGSSLACRRSLGRY
jgi:hypothetical protein